MCQENFPALSTMSGVLTRSQRKKCVDPNDRDHTCLDSSRELQVETFRRKELSCLQKRKSTLRQRRSSLPGYYELAMAEVEYDLKFFREAHWTHITLPTDENEECMGCGSFTCMCD